MRAYRFLLLLPVSALLGCATPQAASSKASADSREGSKELVCRNENAGSKIPETVCRSREQLAWERAQAQQVMTQTWMKPRVTRR